jgi:two-component system NtrC family sensor kinase
MGATMKLAPTWGGRMAQAVEGGAPAGRPVERPPEIGASIPWRARLGTKLLGLVAVLTLAVIGVFALVETQMQRQFRLEVARGAALFSETIRAGTHRAMMEDRRQDAYLTMETIGRQTGIEKVRMLNKEGRVTFSTDPAEVGKLVDKRAESCYACHAAGQALSRISVPSRSRIYSDDGHRVMGMVTPIYNEPACYTAACHVHPPGQQVLGVLDVDLSMAEVDAQVLDFRRFSLVLTAVGVVFLVGFFYLVARAHVLRPVAALVAATRRVAVDQLDTEIRVTTSGELGLLAASFNDMTRSLRDSEQKLKALMENLERQVEERTAALRSAQAQLVRSEKLSSLGRLAASIAHEINNPLAGILTFAKLLIRTMDQGLPHDEAARKTVIRNLQLVQRETERCSTIVGNLLDFARERPMAVKAVDVNVVLEEVVSLLANRIQLQGVTLAKSLDRVPPVKGDFGQLRQAFVNIALNACEAMPNGGALSIATRAVDGDSAVMVEMSDTGCGIPKETLDHIFDPFFTTKEKGTGLGLSVVYGIVQRHGGDVRVESEPGKGTRFKARFPAASARDAAAPRTAEGA